MESSSVYCQNLVLARAKLARTTPFCEYASCTNGGPLLYSCSRDRTARCTTRITGTAAWPQHQHVKTGVSAPWLPHITRCQALWVPPNVSYIVTTAFMERACRFGQTHASQVSAWLTHTMANKETTTTDASVVFPEAASGSGKRQSESVSSGHRACSKHAARLCQATMLTRLLSWPR
jgi:hypothetical protein